MVKNNSEGTRIIPVTTEIREYLKKSEENKKKIEAFVKKYNFSKEKYDIIIDKNNNVIIQNKNIKEKNIIEKIDNKELFLRDVAKKLNKSIIWVYQEMVLSGYGKYIDSESTIYQVAALAKKDVSINLKKEEMIEYENSYLLNGNIYEEKLKTKNLKKIEKRTRWMRIIY